MHPGSPELTVALALAIGVAAQVASHHLRVPGIVLLLAVGVLMGPDVAGIIDPSTLGHALSSLVGFAVAIILFEGGLNLNLSRMMRAGPAVRNLLLIGPAITAAGGVLAARYLLGWSWPIAALFGTLVIVTGPTVVTPLLRRLRIERQTSATLEVEGVLIDAIGAITAVVVLDVVLSGETHITSGAIEVLWRLLGGSIAGLVGGLLIAWLLRLHHLIPDGLENILTLGLVVALFFVCDAVRPESGLAAVTVAGVVIANVKTPLHHEMQEFKEQLTVMLIGLLFVLLAADVRMAEVVALGWKGIGVVAALIFLVRPLNVFISTARTDLNWRQKTLIAWIAPRGIVAAAVASHFANELNEHGLAGGSELRALVFLTIALTVTLAGLSSGPLANLLGLRLKNGKGWVLLGAHELSRTVARAFRANGEECILVDTNPEHCRIAEAEGFQAVHASGLDPRTLQTVALESRRGVIGLAPNEELNLRFVEGAKRDNPEIVGLVGLSTAEETVTSTMVSQIDGRTLFGRDRDLNAWSVQLRHGYAVVEEWRLSAGAPEEDTFRRPGREPDTLLPLVVNRDGSVFPVDESVAYQDGDRVTFAINSRDRSEAQDWLAWWGWERVASKSDSGQHGATESSDGVEGPLEPALGHAN